MIELRHGRVRLALHQLRSGAGVPLLLLHELAASSSTWADLPFVWDGPVFALDFCGHGESASLVGGAYMPELLAGDADAALAHIGSAAVVGAGIGAYVAMLLAAGRAAAVPGALLLPGRGLDGGGEVPDYRASKLAYLDAAARLGRNGCDPMVGFLERDVRPGDYAARLAPGARRLLLLEDGTPRPPWWQTVARAPNAEVVSADLEAALRRLGEV